MEPNNSYISDWDKVSNPALKKECIPNPLYRDATPEESIIIWIGTETTTSPLKATALTDEQV